MVGAEDGSAAQHPLNFGKRLAHTDKVVRDRGFRTLKEWLRKHPELERLDFMKLWKGLYFGMWMSDKRPVQQELCVHIALLINEIPREKQVMWVECFWDTMQDAWEKLDRHRLSKFSLFVRIVSAEVLKVLRTHGWDAEEVRAVAKIVARTSLAGSSGGPNVPSAALLIHYTRIFWEELQAQLGQEPPASNETLMELLEPFVAIAESSGNASVVKATLENMLSSDAVPDRLLEKLAARLAEAAGKPETKKPNREALYVAVEALERRLKPAPAAAEKRGAPGAPGAGKRKRRRASASAAAAAAAAAATGTTGEEEAPQVMSPLMLPKAAMATATKKKKRARGKKAKVQEPAPKPASKKKAGVKRKGKAASAKKAAAEGVGAAKKAKRKKKASA